MGQLLSHSTDNPPFEDIPPPSSDGATLRKLNDSVWELHPPSSQIPEVEIVFFHGLSSSDYEEAFWKTWMVRGGTEIWPKEWLSAQFPKARILAVSYSSYAPKKMGQIDSHIICENLVFDIIASGVGQTCPVILVGHSLGGIIIKGVLLQCTNQIDLLKSRRGFTSPSYTNQLEEKLEKFMNNCKGVFFYSVPNGGGHISDMIHSSDEKNHPLVLLFKTLSTEIARINEDFRHINKDKLHLKTSAMGEERAPPGMQRLLVPKSSAKLDMDHYYVSNSGERSDHFQVCRPKGKWDFIFTKLVEQVQEIVTNIDIIAV